MAGKRRKDPTLWQRFAAWLRDDSPRRPQHATQGRRPRSSQPSGVGTRAQLAARGGSAPSPARVTRLDNRTESAGRNYPPRIANTRRTERTTGTGGARGQLAARGDARLAQGYAESTPGRKSTAMAPAPVTSKARARRPASPLPGERRTKRPAGLR